MATRLHIVTGLLGSGKTSVLQHLTDHGGLLGRTAVLVGEVLDSEFDRARVGAASPDVQLIASDTGDVPTLLRALVDLLKNRGFARALIEVVDPSQAYDVAKAVTSRAITGVELGRTIAVVDGAAFHHHTTHFPEHMLLQFEAADILCVNKNDRLDDAKRAHIGAEITRFNPNAQPVFTTMGQIPLGSLVDAENESTPRLVELVREIAPLPRLESFVYTSDVMCYDRVRLGHCLLNAPVNVARFKGLLRCYSQTWGLTGVPGQLDWDGSPAGGETRIAFMGKDLSHSQEILRKALDNELASQAHPPR